MIVDQGCYATDALACTGKAGRARTSASSVEPLPAPPLLPPLLRRARRGAIVPRPRNDGGRPSRGTWHRKGQGFVTPR